jgi:hypothetical protein
MCKRFKLKSKSIKQGTKHEPQSPRLAQSNFAAHATVTSLFIHAREAVFRGYWKAGANWFISATCQRQASAIFAATIVSESQHTTTATLGGKYAKQK